MRSSLGALLLLTVLLSGCRTVPVRPAPGATPAVPQSWDARRTQLQALGKFALKGRVAVATGSEGFNARLRWSQDGARTHMSLDGPLGAGGVQVDYDGTTLGIVTSHGDRLDGDAARAELASRLGFEPPLGNLRYWILGVPKPDVPDEETLDDQSRLAHLQQDGWQIDYTDYTVVGGQSLPARLNLQREKIRVKVIAEDWNP
jgi:outer membrane lipoprotein LolB